MFIITKKMKTIISGNFSHCAHQIFRRLQVTLAIAHGAIGQRAPAAAPGRSFSTISSGVQQRLCSVSLGKKSDVGGRGGGGGASPPPDGRHSPPSPRLRPGQQRRLVHSGTEPQLESSPAARSADFAAKLTPIAPRSAYCDVIKRRVQYRRERTSNTLYIITYDASRIPPGA